MQMFLNKSCLHNKYEDIEIYNNHEIKNNFCFLICLKNLYCEILSKNSTYVICLKKFMRKILPEKYPMFYMFK